MASMRASIVSMSRWFVGSSRYNRCGLLCVMMANATRLFCPPESVLIVRKAMSPLMPNLPSTVRASWSLMPGYLACTQSTDVAAKSKPSTWCCAKVPTRMFLFTFKLPFVGTN
mmetsp:Transcript_67061/g.125296  ORF Transcript_67061/g.125296 Transcript_67061/m.125296 type:complete len:113 (+) Transcript_67061:64-402(+)